MIDIEPRGFDLPKIDLKEKVKKEKLRTINIKKPEGYMYAINELKDVIKSLCTLGNAINSALIDDGKITIGDFPKFAGFAISLPAAISGIGNVPMELTELSEDEKNELIQFAKDELDLGEHSEEIVAMILKIAYDIKSFIEFIK